MSALAKRSEPAPLAVEQARALIAKCVRAVAPAPEFVKLSSSDIAYIRLKAEERDRFRHYARRVDSWGRGYIKHPILAGMMGEHALSVFLSRRGFPCSLDLELRELGDGGRDFEVGGMIIQVKTNLTARSNYIRRVDSRGNLLPLNCDLFTFGHVADEKNGVFLRGWIWSDDASSSSLNRLRRSPRDEHFNLVVDPRTLLPMSRLVLELRRRAS